ncbi:RNA polymerase sigma factor [Sabulilitoribacter multivorans]|uniref:RNA polymerase sigma factor n=1 Tax=Flaviramulus multivorans TaxID=1304750 RepID=A0ABS9IJX0_9FLAO|nr:RNA polymerase sigma factor [Flaviramulus multivorans]MCF7560901.1 RNA polymerase sigma factor [Flaviramulus multivorans]
MKIDRDIDGGLVKAYLADDRKALAVLVKRWHKSFCEKAYWLVKDADVAKDIAQDSWRTIIDKIDRLNNPESFGSWAMRIVYTKSLDWINTKKRKENHLNTYKYEQELESIETVAEDENLRQKLLSTLKTLPEHQQVVIKLFYVQDYSLKDISGLLNISVGTAKSRLFHAREKLKLILKNRNYEN